LLVTQQVYKQVQELIS